MTSFFYLDLSDEIFYRIYRPVLSQKLNTIVNNYGVQSNIGTFWRPGNFLDR